ncbi:MAG: carboxylesterase family protein [Bacteroidales bacterium]|nr:carboxylesterase family protein [Bacteroidales bacterium]
MNLKTLSIAFCIVILAGCGNAQKNPSFEELSAIKNDKTTHPELNRGTNKEITTADYNNELAVKCANGIFVGKEYADYRAWRGIPFAQAPVGELRWKAPVAPENSDKVYEAYTFAKKPIQFFDNEDVSEDCLYLNVYTSGEKTDEKKPVMVWIHGGGFLHESASDELYRGEDFISNNPDVILVTIEYRLGAFGFICFEDVPGGENYKDSGVLGLLDQICALKWVKGNIEAFGGDSSNITIFGESAGSVSCTSLPLFAASKGLFNRLIGQSCCPNGTFPKESRKFVTETLLRVTGSKTMEDLVKVPSDSIYVHYVEIAGGANPFAPIRDGVNLPLTVEESVAKWKDSVKGLDVMMGYTQHEARYCLSTWMGLNEEQGEKFFANSYKLVKDITPAEIAAVSDEYIKNCPEEKEWERIERMFTIVDFAMPAGVYANSYCADGNVYLYMLALPSQTDLAGSFHSCDVEYVFNHKDRLAAYGRDDELTHQRCDEVQRLWVNFAKTGVPSLDGKEFKKYEPQDKSVIVIDRENGIYNVDHLIDKDVEALKPLLPYSHQYLMESFALNMEKAQ